jgi:AAA15 family ATPase/GTPase
MKAKEQADRQSMLLAFRAQNVRSFRDEVELSLISTRIGRPTVRRSVPWREDGSTVDVLPAAGLFGANASGKSNLLAAMGDLNRYVRTSFVRSDPSAGVGRQPFRLDPSTAKEPSRYEVDLVIDGIRYEYLLAVDDDVVVHEAAYRSPKGKSRMLFERDSDGVRFGADARAIGRAVKSLLRPNALLLSTVGSFVLSEAARDEPALPSLYDWLARNLQLAEADNRYERLVHTALRFADESKRAMLLELVRAADLGISEVRRRAAAPEVIERFRPIIEAMNAASEEDDLDFQAIADGLAIVQFEHQGATPTYLDANEESLGTVVWAGLIGPVADALERGTVLLADELDASLHPLLVERVIGLFQDPETNPRGAQLIFNAHDPGLLGSSRGDGVLGRDQIWFTEKSADGSTSLVPLSDYHPRKEEDIAGRYRSGRYGAVPILSDAEFARAAEVVLSGSDR